LRPALLDKREAKTLARTRHELLASVPVARNQSSCDFAGPVHAPDGAAFYHVEGAALKRQARRGFLAAGRNFLQKTARQHAQVVRVLEGLANGSDIVPDTSARVTSGETPTGSTGTRKLPAR